VCAPPFARGLTFSAERSRSTFLACADCGGRFSADHGCAPNLGQRRTFERQRVIGLPIVERALELDAVVPNEPDDPPADRREQARHLDVGRRHRSRYESL
jgi:hypothetical protein